MCMAMLWAFLIWMTAYVIGQHITVEGGRKKLKDVGDV